MKIKILFHSGNCKHAIAAVFYGQNEEGQFSAIGIYFSGTGNTRHCVETFVHTLDAEAPCIAIENQAAPAAIEKTNFMGLAYPIYFNILPKIVSDFLKISSNKFSEQRYFPCNYGAV